MPCPCRGVFNMKTEAKKIHHVLSLTGYQNIAIFVESICLIIMCCLLLWWTMGQPRSDREDSKSDLFIWNFATGLLQTSCTANILCDLMCHVNWGLYHVLNYCPVIWWFSVPWHVFFCFFFFFYEASFIVNISALLIKTF